MSARHVALPADPSMLFAVFAAVIVAFLMLMDTAPGDDAVLDRLGRSSEHRARGGDRRAKSLARISIGRCRIPPAPRAPQLPCRVA
jgi:hypothetical protein